MSTVNITGFNEAIALVEEEVLTAMAAYPPFNSAHEGWAILKEEVDELWDEVKVKQGLRSEIKMKREAVQAAAMAIRFLIDICDGRRSQV